MGFCLIDSTRRETTGPVSPQYTEAGNDFCAQDNPAASSLTMGISAGWRDVYHRSLAFQWIDVSDVAPGSYRLRAEIDPEGRIRESNEVNPPAFGAGAAVVPGYRATNVGVATAKGPRQVQLAAANVGGLTQAPQFKIVTAPKHGSLDRPVGQWFSGRQRAVHPRHPLLPRRLVHLRGAQSGQQLIRAIPPRPWRPSRAWARWSRSPGRPGGCAPATPPGSRPWFKTTPRRCPGAWAA